MPEDAPPAGMIVRYCEVCLKVTTTMWYRNRDYIVDKLRIQNVDHFESKSCQSMSLWSQFLHYLEIKFCLCNSI